MQSNKLVTLFLLGLVISGLVVRPKPVYAAVSIAQIQAGIHRAERQGASIGVYIVDLSTGKTLMRYHEDQRFPAASVIKMSILGTVYWLHRYKGLKLTPARLADVRDMIGVSDNEAANRLITLCGKDQINRFIVTQLGCHDTQLVHLLNLPHVDGKGYNVTTPHEAAHTLDYLLFNKQFAPYQQAFRSFLTTARWHQPERLVRYIDRDIHCYRKPGTTSHVLNDVAYFENPNTGHRMLASFFSNYGSQEENRELSELISRYLANLLEKRPSNKT